MIDFNRILWKKKMQKLSSIKKEKAFGEPLDKYPLHIF